MWSFWRSQRHSATTCATATRTVLGLSIGARDCGLALQGPGGQVVAEEDVEAGGVAPGVRTTGPVCVRVRAQGLNCSNADVEAGRECALHVAQDALDQREMWLVRVMHEEAHLMHGVPQVRPGECEVLQGTGEAAVLRGVGHAAPSEADSLARVSTGVVVE